MEFRRVLFRSPVSNWTICVVTVVTDSKGLMVSLAASPTAITTIMVSPIARLTASKTPPTMPGRAAGTNTRRMVYDVIATIANEPSRIACGTAFIESSASEETNGINLTTNTAHNTDETGKQVNGRI